MQLPASLSGAARCPPNDGDKLRPRRERVDLHELSAAAIADSTTPRVRTQAKTRRPPNRGYPRRPNKLMACRHIAAARTPRSTMAPAMIAASQTTMSHGKTRTMVAKLPCSRGDPSSGSSSTVVTPDMIESAGSRLSNPAEVVSSSERHRQMPRPAPTGKSMTLLGRSRPWSWRSGGWSRD